VLEFGTLKRVKELKIKSKYSSEIGTF